MATLHRFLCGVSLITLAAVSAPFASAQETPVPASETGTEKPADTAAEAGEEVVVTADRAGLLETKPSKTVFGLRKPLIETPRSASLVSDTTMERYGVETINDLTAVSPGTYTASFFGVPGAVASRGTLADNYFRGFRRIENRGTYTTPLGAASRVEILRGPPSPVYGAGKVGGLLNFVPKTARAGAGFTNFAKLSVSMGSYDFSKMTGEIATPVELGTIKGGIYAYGEYENSSEYYRGISPTHKLFELSADFDLAPGWTMAFGGMVYRSEGDVQSPGWNRLTQDLIDNGTYITGRDTTLTDSDGNGRMTPNEVGGNFCYPFSCAIYQPYYGFPPSSEPRHVLDTGVGTTKLDRRTIYISDADFSKTETNTAYFDLGYAFSDDSEVTLQFFYDDQDNKRFVSYGYPAAFEASVWESRLTYDFTFESGVFKATTLVGAGYRSYDGRRRESYNSGLIALDRRDLSYGATPTDIIDSPFDNDPVCYFCGGFTGVGWENDNNSTWDNTGLFFTTDIYLWENLNVILGARYDWYSVESQDKGGNGTGISYQPSGVWSDEQGDFSYSVSISYKTPWGLMPYFTYAETSALEMSQAGDIAPSLIRDDAWLSDSKLTEAGVKFVLLDGSLVGSLAYYEQERTRLTSGPTPQVQGTTSKGVELEVRYLIDDNFSLTFAGNNQQTMVKGPDNSFTYVPWYTVGVSPQNAFGGSYVVWAFSSLAGRSGAYEYTLIPDTVASLYGTYSSDDYDWGSWGATLGVTYATETHGTVPGAVVFPDYAVLNGSAFIKSGNLTFTLNVDNITDELYFTPGADVYANLSAMPSRGREFRFSISAEF